METRSRKETCLRTLELALAVAVACTLLWGALSLGRQEALADRVVRLHVLANSDSEEDQALKLQVRDSIIGCAEDILRSSHDRQDAEDRLARALPELERLAADTIAQNGYDYSVTAELKDTAFPTREYEDFALPAGDCPAGGHRRGGGAQLVVRGVPAPVCPVHGGPEPNCHGRRSQ